MQTISLVALSVIGCFSVVGLLIVAGLILSRRREQKLEQQDRALLDAWMKSLIEQRPEGLDRLAADIEKAAKSATAGEFEQQAGPRYVMMSSATFLKLMQDQEQDAATKPERWDTSVN